MIEGGYYIKARCIQNSAIAHAPPHFREVWDWLLKEANHEDKKYRGFMVKRGQLFRTYQDIREGLHWTIGYRKMMYNENHTKKAMKYLKKELMITTAKEPGGVLITILNYDKYQDPKNYERTNESANEGTNAEPMRNHGVPTITRSKELEEYKFKQKVSIPSNFTITDKMKKYAKKAGQNGNLKDLTEDFCIYHRKKGSKFNDWYAAWQTWIRNDLKFHPPQSTRKVFDPTECLKND